MCPSLARTERLHKRPWPLRVVSILMLAAAPLAAAPVPSDRPVQEIRIWKRDAGRLAWSAQGDWIAFDKPNERGLYHLWIMKIDGTRERCLTCDPLDFRGTNSLNPAWHPSGDLLVFQVQSSAKRLRLGAVDLSTADRSLWSELWAISQDGKSFWQLTRVNEQGGVLLDPHFSHEGDLLLWSERVRSRVGRWGRWVLRVAEVRIKRGIPRLTRPRTYEPGNQRLHLQASGFAPDDGGVLLAGNLESGQLENGMDIYLLELEEGNLTRLTHSRRSWDEQAHFSVKGDRIIWSSASEIDLRSIPPQDVLPPEQLRDLWIMNADGSGKQRLTYFNHPSSPESVGVAIVDDFDWNPRGDQLAAHVLYALRGELKEAIYLVALDSSFRR